MSSMTAQRLCRKSNHDFLITMQITFFTAMEETLKKALRTGIQTLISVTEEVRHGLTVLENDIRELSAKVGDAKPLEKTGQKLDELVEKSINAIRAYEERAVAVSRKIQEYLGEVDPTARQSVEELSRKLNSLSHKLSGDKPHSL